jgi:hypothetical protein
MILLKVRLKSVVEINFKARDLLFQREFLPLESLAKLAISNVSVAEYILLAPGRKRGQNIKLSRKTAFLPPPSRARPSRNPYVRMKKRISRKEAKTLSRVADVTSARSRPVRSSAWIFTSFSTRKAASALGR